MAEVLKILFISAEVAPYAKVGGLADVAGSLPKALSALGHDVRVVMPAYGEIESSLHDGRYNLDAMPGQLYVPIGGGTIQAGAFEGRLPGSDVPIYFIAERDLLNRPNVYGYDDDPYRFAFFSRAVFELAAALGWRPDIVHANDWHTAPAVAWLDTAGWGDERFQGIPSLFTIHNLAHQGRSSWAMMEYLGIWSHSLTEEAYGEVNFMARGIYHATKVNTVSPTYAQEIMTPPGGFGLDGLLRHRSYDVHGILNGLDYAAWDPATDSRLAGRFDGQNLAGRALNKRALQARSGLPESEEIPLVAMISRLDAQKGLDITGHVIHLLLNSAAGEAQFVVLGSGAAEYEIMFAQLAGYHRDKMAVFLEFNPDLAPLIYAGSDIFLMPSLFEPCGLGQMIAMRYGSLPVVRSTGGLADTVQDGVTGFTFFDYAGSAFWDALARALTMYGASRESWSEIQANAMAADFSWQSSALGYQQLYEWAIAQAG
jgi:starch synthase